MGFQWPCAAQAFSPIGLVWADGAYAGRLVSWTADVLRLSVTVVKRCDGTAGSSCCPAGGRWKGPSAGNSPHHHRSATSSPDGRIPRPRLAPNNKIGKPRDQLPTGSHYCWTERDAKDRHKDSKFPC
jgi:hypothetical protein